MTRRLLALLLSAFAGSLVLGVAAPAQAADIYRYWSFFTVESGVYKAADVGVGGLTPADGSIEAFRWAAPAEYPPNNLPRIDLATVTFESVCADTAAVAGQKRVAVLVDFGVTEDAGGVEIPGATAECAQVDTTATALQVMQKVTEVRTKSESFGPVLCAIDGFPAAGCGDAKVDTATPADSGFVTVTGDEPAAEDDDSNTALYAGLGAIVVVLLAGGAFVARRNKSA